MYEIRCTVGDKKLREVLVFLRNNRTMPVVIPLDGGDDEETVKGERPTVPNKKRRKPLRYGSRQAKGTGAVTIIRDMLDKAVTNKVLAREMRDATMAAGYREGSYSHGMKLLVEEGVIKPLGFGHYQIMKKTEKPA